MQRICQLSGIVKELPAFGQLFLFARFEVRCGDFIELITQHVDALGALLFALFQLTDFAPQRKQAGIQRAVLLQQRFGITEAVEKIDVIFLLHQFLAVVLAVDVD